jgi:uncharacterized protein (DUF2267 family)
MDHEALIEDVLERAGLGEDRLRAAQVIEGTLRGLASQLEPSDARALAEALPGELGRIVRDAQPLPRSASAAAVFALVVARAEGTQPGFALEHAQAACQALAWQLEPDLLVRLRRRLPQQTAELLELRAPAPPPPPHPTRPPVPPGHGRTLSTGRPGSTHPLGSAAPLAHRHSVARSDDPHADTRLSSSRGLSAERRGETLAAGKPGSRRPISES